jgi:hypothetical protein
MLVPTMLRSLAAAFVGVLALFGRPAAAHGFMVDPPARNLRSGEDCPHCLNAGGPWLVYGASRHFPNGRHGVCGDPHGDRRPAHEAGGRLDNGRRVVRTYRRGSVITIKIEVTADHKGYFEFKACPAPSRGGGATERRQVTQRCFDAHPLRNADDGSKKWWLRGPGEGTHRMRFRLPKNLRCERCVLQWHWVSANSCRPPGASPGYASGMCACGKECAQPEEFWNCADVRVR